MTRAHVLATLAMGVLLTADDMLAQQGQQGPVTAPAAGAKAWSFAASVYTYLLPDEPAYAQPTVTADRGRLHLEARYQYEDLNTGSAWIGRNFSVGREVAFDVTPMLGLVLGNTDGIAPGYRASLAWRTLELSSESEYLLSASEASENFFYTWSELAWGPADWFRLGLSVQRTRAYETDLDIQRGFLLGLTYKRAEFSAYLFNPDASRPILVLGIGLNF